MKASIDNYELCYENLCKELVDIDPKTIAHNCDIIFDEEKQMFLTTFLNKDITVEYPLGIIRIIDTDNSPSVDYLGLGVMERILIISFLLRCKAGPLTGDWVPLRELQGIGFTYDKFAQDGLDKFIKYFSGREDLLLQVGDVLGAKRDSRGDVAIEIEVLPKVPLIFVLWYGDDEFPTTASALFDYSATDKLHVEDLAGLPDLIIKEVIVIAKQL